MKKPCLYILIIFIVSLQTYGQEQRVFKQGIYTSWEELINEVPKHKLPATIQYKKVRTYNILDEIHRIAVLEVSKEKADKIGGVFAFSDGKELFINEKKPNLSQNPFFTVVEMHGANFGIYNDLFSIGLNKKIGIGEFPMYCKISGTNIIDISNKSITEIKNKKDLKKIIASDKELLEQFQSEDDKNEVIKLYIIQYLLRK